MAQEQVATISNKAISATQKAKEFEEHTGTYAAFLFGAKWSVIVTVVLLIGLYFIFIH